MGSSVLSLYCERPSENISEHTTEDSSEDFLVFYVELRKQKGEKSSGRRPRGRLQGCKGGKENLNHRNK